MEGKSFAKMCKDTKIIDKKLDGTNVDLIFAKSKDKSERRINFDQFFYALNLCAQKKGVAEQDLYSAIAASKGPVLRGTKAEKVKLHDDKSQYTGVYAKGGPSTVDTDKYVHLDGLLDRSDADVRGRKVDGINSSNVQHLTHQVAGQLQVEEKKKSTSRGNSRGNSAQKTKKLSARGDAYEKGNEEALAQDLQSVFLQFSAGAKEIDGKVFAKLAKDCSIVNKQCTTTDIDLIFAKVKDKGSRKITFAQFQAAVDLCAEKRGLSGAEMETTILFSGGKRLTGTQAEKVKWHDDKELYTGVYAKGGPTNVDTGRARVDDISSLCDRGAADVRGVQLK